MTAAQELEVLSVKDKVSEEEWQLRVDLAALYRLVALSDIVDYDVGK